MKRSVAVTIAGQHFRLRSDAEAAYVERVASIVDARFRDIQRVSREVDTRRVAMLTALQIADDLLRERDRRAALRQTVRARSKRLLEVLASFDSSSTPAR